MKRLGIYVIYDCENIVDDYIGYMLQELRVRTLEGVFKISMPMRTEYIIETIQALTQGLTRMRCVVLLDGVKYPPMKS